MPPVQKKVARPIEPERSIGEQDTGPIPIFMQAGHESTPDLEFTQQLLWGSGGLPALELTHSTPSASFRQHHGRERPPLPQKNVPGTHAYLEPVEQSKSLWACSRRWSDSDWGRSVAVPGNVENMDVVLMSAYNAGA
ncbi:uncharacterized protein LY89DRAFT_729810 [Mollisia scopiformis]|uniref:Uncharacterized protein n=1 Tax=Mollisia scopiformis TaxID=149040 RepID=A0A194XL92_MOLSC|nr:uncharacterized protein LY89DRAFT_729810 [Mollisia scopiformis]KUJ21005.1 hypothetical protein LY89DRAFT_729810 [Mollisia scopiformis]